MHVIHPRLATLALAGVALVGPTPAADLELDGKSSVKALMGSRVTVTVRGNPGSPAVLLVDVSPGPTTLFGRSLPLGFVAARAIALGSTNATGEISVTLTLPSSPSLHEVTLYTLAVVVDPAAPFGLDFSNGADLTLLDRNVELAGHALGQYPYFESVRAVNQGSTVQLGIDPTRYPAIVGRTADVYVVASKTRSEWIASSALVDVAGGPQTVAFGGSTIQANTITLDGGSLPGPDATPGSGDTRLGVAYDVVIDFGQDGRFDADTDLIDGYHESLAGFYVVRDTTAGASGINPTGGPHAVSELLYSGGVFLSQVTYFPTAIASMGQLPLVVISHGNGHDYQWYDHIGYHLASYGYIVMSHSNETGPGSGTAAASTIANTDFIIQYQHVIGGGVLNGHIDTGKIVWIGHSRGGDGVTRAYDSLFTGAVTPASFSVGDIVLVDAIAPVDFGGFSGQNPILNGTSGSNPHDATFHLWVGQADADVSGCAQQDQLQWYHLHERATAIRQSISLYGVGHGDFHNAFGFSSVAAGPSLIGRPTTHLIMRGYMLPLVKHYVEGSVPARDFLWRQYESFRPIGVPFNNAIVANLLFQDSPASGKFVIDDFQDVKVLGPTPGVASSGAPVTTNTPAYVEGAMDDADGVFSFIGGDPFNGFTMDGEGGTGPFRSESFGCVFNFNSTTDFDVTYDVSATQPRFCDFAYLSFRAAQGSRHPFTTGLASDLTFAVTLEDSKGVSSSINISAYGDGIEQPYQRDLCNAPGTPPPDVGWNTEFETIRIRLTDFLANGNRLDLSSISKLRFDFGPSWGSGRGRVGLDEIELTAN